MSESLRRMGEVYYVDFQRWCEAICAELKDLERSIDPNIAGIIDSLIQDVDEFRANAEATFGTSANPDFGRIKSQLVLMCESKLSSIVSVDAQKVLAAAEERASKLP